MVTTAGGGGTTPYRRRRPGGLSRSVIVDAGRRVAEREGLGAVTIRRVASDLSVAPMALYRHVADKRELVVTMLDDVARGLPILPDEGEPRELLALAFVGLRDHLAASPWAVEALRGGEIFGPAVLPHVERVLELLARSGLDERETVDAYWALWWFTFGHLSNLPAALPEGRRERMAQMTRTGTAGLPRVRRMGEMPLDEGAADRAFRAGLEALIEGLLPA
ncbi:TetR family transcriptional regulator [Streptomyces alkaliphilus]|uniref:TetR family transcriptional regulator n=1 Tax=Streptomyces alkaliphilus TaxID=1472722 RepID=A0A7W3TDB7_9ACTN|nr:TetR/AcrR family transcriptional regulator [Streptomyces alkaliphilus]MBB0244774.1 TetR family transcriptional regulator [Streptomyces alkaliphilus]